MADFHRVPVERPLPRNWLATLGWGLAIGIGVVVLKPWATGSEPQLSPGGSASVEATVPGSTPSGDRRRYDPRLFGGREPDPAWELWPAGYVVLFGMAGPVRVDASAAPEPSGSAVPTREPGASPGRSPGPSPGASMGAGPSPTPADPADVFVVDLGPTDHLIALGINHPSDVVILDVHLWGQDGDACCPLAVPILRLEPLWESHHFVVIGIEDPDEPGVDGPWPPGEYRLDLQLGGGEVRSVRLRVDPPAS